jgi:hypothetical protein
VIDVDRGSALPEMLGRPGDPVAPVVVESMLILRPEDVARGADGVARDVLPNPTLVAEFRNRAADYDVWLADPAETYAAMFASQLCLTPCAPRPADREGRCDHGGGHSTVGRTSTRRGGWLVEPPAGLRADGRAA